MLGGYSILADRASDHTSQQKDIGFRLDTDLSAYRFLSYLIENLICSIKRYDSRMFTFYKIVDIPLRIYHIPCQKHQAMEEKKLFNKGYVKLACLGCTISFQSFLIIESQEVSLCE